jgi:sulfur carrier protein
MQIHLNGEPQDVPDDITVSGLLTWLSVTAPRVAVEVNAQVVTRARHADTALRPGDQVEVVTFVGGG